MEFLCRRKGYRMLTIKEEQERTLWIGNLPDWVDEKYLCLCFFLFDSVSICFQIDSWCNRKLGELVKIIKDEQTGRSKCYGFMTFQTHDEAEKILYTYNGVKVMPGTKDRFFCLNWAFERSTGAKPKYKYSKIRIMTYSRSSNNQSQSPARFQLANSNMQVKKSSNYLISSSRLPSIPLDLIYDILLRLPAESIMRLRSTCKAWASLTSTPHFTYQHLKKRMSLNDPIVAFKHSSTGEDKLYFFTNYSTEPAYSFRNFKFPSGFVTWNGNLCTLSNSCNGLVCVYNTSFVNVVNPTIRETAQLPKNFTISKQRQKNCTISVGIGYDDSSDTYKIVRILGNIFLGTEYEIFTLGGGADASCNWRQLEQIHNYMASDIVPVFLNGAIHWLLYDNFFQENSKSKLILSIDVRTEATHTLPVPEDIGFCKLIELGGCLCIIENDQESKEVNLYILEDYANCNWIKKHTINDFLTWFRPVATRDGKLLFPTYYYDMKNGTSGETISRTNSSQRLDCYDFIHGCAESLVSPISYLQRSKNPCAIFPIFGQRWAAQFPMNLPSFVRY